MKIGILTFHNAHNYGAVLQAYALRTVLRKMGHDAAILNYRNFAIERAYPMDLDTEDIQKQEDWRRQYQRFEQFIVQILLEGHTDILKAEDLPCMDTECFVCGSDQIWESGLTGGIDPVYFLDFKCRAKKISYAASKALASIPEEKKAYFKRSLSRFSGVSVRERTVADELQKIGITAVHVLDPTLLLEARDYVDLSDNEKKEKEKYVLAYFIIEDETLKQCAGQAAMELGLKVKEIHFYRVADSTRDKMADCGPKEFIELFKDAEYIFTNSFHGVIFSIIFRKSFYAVYQKDSRKDSFLREICLEDRHITKLSELILSEVDFERTLELLNREKEFSIKFLERQLQED